MLDLSVASSVAVSEGNAVVERCVSPRRSNSGYWFSRGRQRAGTAPCHASPGRFRVVPGRTTGTDAGPKKGVRSVQPVADRLQNGCPVGCGQRAGR